jgi:pimeloyl-ACP methyl ester carboxylesterase
MEARDGLRITVTTSGGGPRHVLFVHGFRNAGAVWAPVMERLPEDFTALAPDLPGCGTSDRPARWERCTIAAYAGDVTELIEVRGLTRPVLVGHSLGAAIGIRIALDRPGLLGGLVLVAPSSTRGLDFLSAQQIEVLAHPTSDDELVALARAAFRRPPAPEVLEQVMAIVRSASPQHIEGAVYSSRDFRVEEELRGLTCQTLLIAGDRDKHVPLRNHLATAMAVPRCGLQVFTDVGHVPFVEVPDEFDRVLARFLNQVSPAKPGVERGATTV